MGAQPSHNDQIHQSVNRLIWLEDSSKSRSRASRQAAHIDTASPQLSAFKRLDCTSFCQAAREINTACFHSSRFPPEAPARTFYFQAARYKDTASTEIFFTRFEVAPSYVQRLVLDTARWKLHFFFQVSNQDGQSEGTARSATMTLFVTLIPSAHQKHLHKICKEQFRFWILLDTTLAAQKDSQTIAICC